MTRSESFGAVDGAYDFIRKAISSGEFPEGYRLTETEIAERSGFSRTPVREAIRRLSAEGYAVMKPRFGASVASWNRKRIADLFDLRSALESHGCALAARLVSQSEIKELRGLCETMETLMASSQGDFFETFSEANTRFHVRILEISGNELLLATAAPMIDLALIRRTYRRFSPDRLRRSCEDHRDIVTALSNRDASWAEAAMKAHILASTGIAAGDAKETKPKTSNNRTLKRD